MPRRWNPRSGFQQGHPFYRSSKVGAYAAPRPPTQDNYELVETVPDGQRWKPAPWGGRAANNLTVMYTIGNIYKLVRVRATGAVTYYKLKDTGPEISPAEKIDAEPKRKQVRYPVNAHCWFVDVDRWYCVRVAERSPGRIVIESVTGWDAERVVAWPYGALLEFPARANNPLFARLRPLKDRRT